jgi:hypothetical protein
VLAYRGLTESQVDELLTQEAQPVLEARHSAAQALLQCAVTFLQRQAAEWQLAVQALSSWLGSVVSLFESHKAGTAAAETDIKAALRAAVRQFEAEDAAREAALAEAVLLLSQGSDEKELDVRLEAALQALSVVQAGYRSHAAAAVSTVRAYPGQVKGSNDVYSRCLCGLLHVQPSQPPAGSTAGGTGAQHPAGAAGAVSVAGSVASAAAQAVSAAAATAELLTGSPPVHGQVQLPTGGLYQQLHDLWQGLMDATPKPWLAQFSHMQQADASAQQLQQQPSAHADAVPAPTVSGAGGKPTAAGAAKMTKQQLAEAAEEAARAAEAAAAAAAAEAAAYAAAVAQPPSPASSSSEALCLSLSTPDGTISEGLLNLQVGCD